MLYVYGIYTSIVAFMCALVVAACVPLAIKIVRRVCVVCVCARFMQLRSSLIIIPHGSPNTKTCIVYLIKCFINKQTKNGSYVYFNYHALSPKQLAARTTTNKVYINMLRNELIVYDVVML